MQHSGVSAAGWSILIILMIATYIRGFVVYFITSFASIRDIWGQPSTTILELELNLFVSRRVISVKFENLHRRLLLISRRDMVNCFRKLNWRSRSSTVCVHRECNLGARQDQTEKLHIADMSFEVTRNVLQCCTKHLRGWHWWFLTAHFWNKIVPTGGRLLQALMSIIEFRQLPVRALLWSKEKQHMLCDFTMECARVKNLST